MTLFDKSICGGNIISASRRTDIPAFYADWFIGRLKAGYALARNPFNVRQVKKVSLLPEDVCALVFWTRDFSPMMPHIKWLDAKGYRYVILWTITGYGSLLEPDMPPLDYCIEALRTASYEIGAERIAWRYDPIIITDEFSPQWHLLNFTRLAEALAGYVSHIIISLMTPYRSVVRRIREEGIQFCEEPLSHNDVRSMLLRFAEITASLGINRIQSCCQCGALAELGIADGACIDTDWISRVIDVKISAQKDTGQRKNCLCAKSIDIGAYDTCPRGCLYCYAVKSPKRAKRFSEVYKLEAEALG